MFAIAAPFTEHMFAPARLRDSAYPAPQLPPKYSRGTGNRRLGYQDHFSWLRKKYPGRKICHKKRPAFHLVVVLSFSTTTKYKEIVVLIRPYSVSTFSTWSRLDGSSPQQMERCLFSISCFGIFIRCSSNFFS